MKNVIYLILLLFGSDIVLANDWYVSPTVSQNSNGNGSLSSPWDLQTALSHPAAVQPGDTIWLRGGTYHGHFLSNLNGTSTNYITLSSYPGEWAVIDGNIYPYVAGAQPPADPETLPNDAGEARLTAPNDQEETDPAILRVDGGFVKYTNFEVTCLGPINRLYEYVVDIEGTIIGNCAPNNGFHKMSGINHSAGTKNKFINLVVRNVPGVGIGSWKSTADSEIYGCVLYYNGYIAYSRLNSCSATLITVLGKGPGIYTQNNTELNRLIKNNFILNNYDSGILVWSASTNPSSDYVKNYIIKDNVFVNNGGPQRDETSNLLISSATTNSFNKPFGVEVFDNVFYANSSSSWNSGTLFNNTKGVNFHHNYTYKGTVGDVIVGDVYNSNGVLIARNTNLSYHHNLYAGKRTQINTTVYAPALNNNFYNNKYYRRTGVNVNGEFITELNPNTPLATIKQTYNEETNSEGYWDTVLNACYNIATIGGADPNVMKYDNPSCGSTYIPNITKVVQNEYDTSKYYVSIFNSQSHISSQVNASFSNIPVGTPYKIRDVQNYFGGYIAQGNLGANQQLTFDLSNNSGFEIVNGFYVVIPALPLVHSYKDFGTYIVEFSICEPNKTITTAVVAGNTDSQQAQFTITASNTIESTANARYHAGTSVILSNGFHSKSGSIFRAYIEGCSGIYFGRESSENYDNSSDYSSQSEKSLSNYDIKIYPNPTNSLVTITADNYTINKLIVNSVDGKQIFSKEIDPTYSFELDASNFTNGIYILTIETKEGTVFTKKLVKK